MRLELAHFPVKDIRFGGKTGYQDGALEVDKANLLDLVSKDKRIVKADLDLALPGEQTRIVRVRDVVEPRIKVSGPGFIFPGIMGPVETVGEGKTNRLSDFSVMVTADYNAQLGLGSGSQNSGVIDMWQPGASLSPFGSLNNLVLVLKLADGLSELEAHSAIQSAELKVAHRLAETTLDITPENTEVFEQSEVDPSLPRVVYDATISTTWHEPLTYVLYYGLPIRDSLSTLIHPNEIIDGALSTDARRGNGEIPSTWEWMNNPVVFGLLREHGKSVNFLGVILQRTRFEAEWCKFVGAGCAAQMGRILKADGVIITKISPSGNNSMDLMFTVQAFEKNGIKTVFITPEYGGAEGVEPALWYFAPEADAMVSTSSLDRGALLPAPNKVIGCERDEIVEPYPAEKIAPWQELDAIRRSLFTGGIDYLGFMRHTCRAS